MGASWNGIAGPANLPRPIVMRVNPGRVANTGLGAMAHDLAMWLLDIVGKHALAFDAAVNQVTAPKSDEEIANARKAVAIAEEMHLHMLATARAGMRECDLEVEMNL